ncbi:uncharacterized protein TEOVI_000645100 [Trypanosoma equiperdum]|uniref:Uncharacterized protein n=1 Tax=Trypanosoma equiperdum TaxID=5694 RepID=A0A1G4IAV4_TRYEQ|nr:hypothetical protein, conserved [Trypanosoma equiperdum]
MELLNVLPHEAALHRLMRAGVCNDDQMHDYFISQAFRGIAYAVNRATLPAPVFVQQPFLSDSSNTTGSSGGTNDSPTLNPCAAGSTAATTTGAVCVLCRMCVQAVTSHMSHRTAAYLATRLLADEATAFGEGNERPCCTVAWVEALCSVGKASFLQQQLGVNRRMALGYLYILAETVRATARGRVIGKRLSSHFVEFAHRILDDVIPYLAIMADAREVFAVTRHVPVAGNPSEGNIPTETTSTAAVVPRPAWHPPSRLTVEANNTIIHLFHDIAHDIIDVHHRSGKNPGERCLVLDRDMPSRMWPAVSILQSALHRALDWILQEGLACVRTMALATEHREEKAAIEAVQTVKKALDDTFAQMFERQETLECSRQAVERQYGKGAKDYHGITDTLWANTLRLCLLCRNVTGAWIEVYGGAGYTETRSTDKNVLSFIASFVSSVPLMDGDETESSVFLATIALLSAALAAVVAAPVPFMQVSLWVSDTALTGQVHNVVIQRGLRYKDELVQRLSALISQLILSGSSLSGASRAIVESSDQLLELISNGRDAASHCVIRMLSRAILERPHSMLPALFRLLQHGDVKTRRNVLDVLSALPQMDDEAGLGEKLVAEQMRPMLRQLSEELLLRIQDEELLVRLQGSKLFAKVWPEDVIRPLLNLATQKDKSHKKQSAAQQALRSVVAAHTGDSRVVLLLLDESLKLVGETTPTAPTAPNTPAGMLAFAQLHSCVGEREGEGDGAGGQPGCAAATGGLTTISAAGGFCQRLMGIALSLVKRWAEEVPSWSEPVLQPIVDRVVSARSPKEQEFAVRFIAQVSSLCGITVEGAAALTSCVLRVVQGGKTGSLPSERWLTGLCGSRQSNNSNEKRDEIALVEECCPVDSEYRMIAPLLCLRGCPRRPFLSCRVDSMPPSMLNLWEFIWFVLFSSDYCEQLTPDTQRLLLELVCKYRTSMVLERFAHFERMHLEKNGDKERKSCEGNSAYLICADKQACFLFRAGFFCTGTLVAQSSLAFTKPATKDGESQLGVETATTSSPEGSCEEAMELLDLVHAAELVSRWTESVVFPWLLGDNDDETTCSRNPPSDLQRLSRSAIDCIALLTVVALNRAEFDAHVSRLVRNPLSELALLYREEVKQSKKDVGAERKEAFALEKCGDLLGRFEFAVQVHSRVLNILRASQMGRGNVCTWFIAFMPHLIELANAACGVAARLGRNDVGQVAVECCNVLFLAAMSSSGGPPAVEGERRATSGESDTKPLLMDLCTSDRSALLAFAVGSSRYSSLPAVQSEGVKLLSALLGAAPDIFVDTAAGKGTALDEAFSALSSVALLHEDCKTRSLAEAVISTIQKTEQI